MNKLWAILTIIFIVSACTSLEYVADDVYYTPEKRVYCQYDYWYPFNNWYTFNSPYLHHHSPYFGSYWYIVPIYSYYSSPYFYYNSPYYNSYPVISGNIWQYNYYNFYWVSGSYDSYPVISGNYYGPRKNRGGGTTIPKGGIRGGITTNRVVNENTTKTVVKPESYHKKRTISYSNDNEQNKHQHVERKYSKPKMYNKPDRVTKQIQVYQSLPNKQFQHKSEYKRTKQTYPSTGTQRTTTERTQYKRNSTTQYNRTAPTKKTYNSPRSSSSKRSTSKSTTSTSRYKKR